MMRLVCFACFLTLSAAAPKPPEVATVESHTSNRTKEAPPPCFPGWTFHNGRCYGFGETTVTLGDAMSICRNYDAMLAEIESPEENEFLKHLARDRGASLTWIGGTDMFHEGVWEWLSTRKSIYEGEVTDWHTGEPNNSGGNEDCLVLHKDTGYRWADVACSGTYNFICKARPQSEFRHPAYEVLQ